MRRLTRLGLAVAALLLVAAIGGYTAFWFIAAGRMEDGIGEWAQSLRPQNLDLSWRAVRVGGFPLAFEVEIDDARLRDGGAGPGGEVHAPVLFGSARSWDFRVWRLAAPKGLSAVRGPAERPVARLSARAASGSVAVSGEGGATLWIGISDATADFGERFTIGEAGIWLTLPVRPAQTHAERAIGVALDIRGLTLPAVPAPFRNPVDEIALGITVMGPIPAGSPRSAAAAWRDSGGTVELDHFAARGSTLAISGSGTAALDQDLQPMGAFSGAIEGYEELIAAFVAAGRIRPGEAGLARLALGMLAKRGPGGRPTISTSFTIQNGEMRLGPARLGKAPRITWD